MGLLGSLSDDDKALGLLNLGAAMIAGNRGPGKGAAFQNAIGSGMGAYTNTLSMLGRQNLARQESEQREALRRAQEEALRMQAERQAQQQAALSRFAAQLPPELQALAAVSPQTAIDRAFPKSEPYTLAPGAMRFDPSNRMVAQAPSAPPEIVRALEAAGIKPGTPEFANAMSAFVNKQITHAPAASVSVQNYPNPIPVVGPDGKPTLVQFGNKGGVIDTGMRPPMTPDERRAQREEQKEGLRAENVVNQAQSVLQTIREAKEMVGPLTAGMGGAVTSRIPGTPAYDLQQKVLTVKANIGFDRLQQMREASPTGGALGQVAVQELNSLQATIASLDANQSPAQLRDGLEKVEKHYSAWLKAVDQAKGSGQEATPATTRKRYNPATGKIE